MSKTTILVSALSIAVIGVALLFYFAVKNPSTPGSAQSSGTSTPLVAGNRISTQSQIGGDKTHSAPLPKFIPDPNKLFDSTKKLSFEERQRLSLFIGNMAGTIQTYGYDDFTDISALSDYFTTKGQATLQAYTTLLKQNTKTGYRQYAVADSTAQIALYYNPTTKVYTASVLTFVYDLSDLRNAKATREQIIDFELVRDGSKWKFENVSLYTK